MTNAISMFQIALPLVFGTVLAVSATVMLVTGRAPSYYRHAVRRVGAGEESTFYFWSIVSATLVASTVALGVGGVLVAAA